MRSLVGVDGRNDLQPSVIAVASAVSRVGAPYRYGAAEGDAMCFDCSSLVQWAWQQAGIALPRVAAEQFRSLPHVKISAIMPGDLLFYRVRGRADRFMGVDHVAMYVGNDRIVEASSRTMLVHTIALSARETPVGAARPGPDLTRSATAEAPPSQ